MTDPQEVLWPEMPAMSRKLGLERTTRVFRSNAQRWSVSILILLVANFSRAGGAEESSSIPWNIAALSQTPSTWEDPLHSTGDIKAVFYEGLPYCGKPTRVFAYYGLPKIAMGTKVPAMVLVHGGGGTAFIPWVKLWVDRGYAAIAMDTCGCVSTGGFDQDGQPHPRHDYGGPPGWGGFDQIDEPIKDQWTYHAVADVILAHSLIRSFPQVDADKVGLTGISWGGYLSCVVAGVDSRFRFVAPVYGCGFLGDAPGWFGDFHAMGQEKARRWLDLWDPSVYLVHANMPLLWVDGSNDHYYPLDSLQRSYRLPTGSRTLCTRVRMTHSHGDGIKPCEIYTFAESVVNNGIPLAQIEQTGRKDRMVWITFKSKTPIVKAELNYTTDTGKWENRTWHTLPAALCSKTPKASALLPPKCTVYYWNLIDRQSLVVSNEHEELLLETR
jgi:dienelactone hydrolase